MKKYLTLANVLKCAAVVFGLVAFFMMFTNQIFTKSGNNYFYLTFAETFFGGEVSIVVLGTKIVLGTFKGAAIGFVGYLLILVATICACSLIFLKLEKRVKLFASVTAGLFFILGAVFIFVTPGSFATINEVDPTYKLAGGAVVGAIFAILSALLVCVSEFVKDKKLVK